MEAIHRSRSSRSKSRSSRSKSRSKSRSSRSKSRSRSHSRSRSLSSRSSSSKSSRSSRRRSLYPSPPKTKHSTRRYRKGKLHSIGICEQDNSILVNKLQQFAVDNNVAEGLDQLQRCILARRSDRFKLSKKGFPPDQKHDDMIDALVRILPKYRSLLRRTPAELASVKIRFYSKPKHAFIMMLNGSVVL